MRLYEHTQGLGGIAYHPTKAYSVPASEVRVHGTWGVRADPRHGVVWSVVEFGVLCCAVV